MRAYTYLMVWFNNHATHKTHFSCLISHFSTTVAIHHPLRSQSSVVCSRDFHQPSSCHDSGSSSSTLCDESICVLDTCAPTRSRLSPSLRVAVAVATMAGRDVTMETMPEWTRLMDVRTNFRKWLYHHHCYY